MDGGHPDTLVVERGSASGQRPPAGPAPHAAPPVRPAWADDRLQAPRPWTGFIGTVRWSSPRGIIALLIMAVVFLALFAGPATQVVRLLGNKGSAVEGELSVASLILNFALNAVVMVALPAFAVLVSNLGALDGLRRRFFLVPRLSMILELLLGAAVAVSAILLLAAGVWVLSELGWYEEEESVLVPQIQNLLTWPLVFLIPLVAAVTEEVFFRALLVPRIGVVASSVVFGLVHVGCGTWLQVVAPILLGMVFAALLRRVGSLWPPISAHYVFNFIQLFALKVGA